MSASTYFLLLVTPTTVVCATWTVFCCFVPPELGMTFCSWYITY
uniref:Uncharacterized protein n=1 Tax=Arundo donax TaxID=35708 RepID=A0A0A8YPN7_ARUDO